LPGCGKSDDGILFRDIPNQDIVPESEVELMKAIFSGYLLAAMCFALLSPSAINDRSTTRWEAGIEYPLALGGALGARAQVASIACGIGSIAFLLVLRASARTRTQNATPVTCRSCGATYTFARWKTHGGCQRCGSDLYT
jgi:hypothetical protein